MAECAGIGDGEKARILALYVRKSFEDSDDTYGYRRVHVDLVAWGVPAGPELVRSVMRELGLEPCQRRPWRVSLTEGDGQEHDIADLVHRDFTAGAPGEKMVGDITYISTTEGWLFLATVIDCHTKAVIGGRRRYGRVTLPPFIGDRHTEQGSLCVLGRRRSGRNCCAHPLPATRRPERSGDQRDSVPRPPRRAAHRRPGPASVRGTHPAAHRFPVPRQYPPGRPTLYRVSPPARLTRAFSGPVTVLPGG